MTKVQARNNRQSTKSFTKSPKLIKKGILEQAYHYIMTSAAYIRAQNDKTLGTKNLIPVIDKDVMSNKQVRDVVKKQLRSMKAELKDLSVTKTFNESKQDYQKFRETLNAEMSDLQSNSENGLPKGKDHEHGSLLYDGTLEGIKIKAFVDTGCLRLPYNMRHKDIAPVYISQSIAKQLKDKHGTNITTVLTPTTNPTSFSITVGNETSMECTEVLRGLTVNMAKGWTEQVDCFVLPVDSFDMVLGLQWFQRRKPEWDHETLTMKIPSKRKGKRKSVRKNVNTHFYHIPLSGTTGLHSYETMHSEDTSEIYDEISQYNKSNKVDMNLHQGDTKQYCCHITYNGNGSYIISQPEIVYGNNTITQLTNMEVKPWLTLDAKTDEPSVVIKQVLGEKVKILQEPIMTSEGDSTFVGQPTKIKEIENILEPEVEKPPTNDFAKQIMKEYKTKLFPKEIPKFPHAGRKVAPLVEITPGKEEVYPCRSANKMSVEHQHELLTQITYYLDKGWIQPSNSPYGSCVLFVPKKNGKLRMCIDYRAINTITKKDKYSMPDAEQIIDNLQGAKYFSSIDLSHGYHQCILDKSDIPKTAFRTIYGSYEWKVMTFGLSNAVPTFVRMMNEVLLEHLGKYCMCFLDDLVIYSKTLEDHHVHVRKVLDTLHKANLYVNWVKSEFNAEQIEYLGLKINKHGISPIQNKVQAITEWTRPETVYHLRSFLGSVGYYRKFIYNFSAIAAPLTELTKEHAERQKAMATNVTMSKWGRKVSTQAISDKEWDDKCEQAFQSLKLAITTAPVLALPDNDKDYEMMTDASQYASGAVLMQRDENKKLHPVAYYSSKHTAAETGYPVHEFELVAIYKALSNWRHLLMGKHVTIFTDHKPLTHLLKQPTLSPRQQRWISMLSEYDMDIVAVEGTRNVVADALSRYDVNPSEISSTLTNVVELLKDKYTHNVQSNMAPMLRVYDSMGFSAFSTLTPITSWYLHNTSMEDHSNFFGGADTHGSAEQDSTFNYDHSAIASSVTKSYKEDETAQTVLNNPNNALSMKVINKLIFHMGQDGMPRLYIPSKAEITPTNQSTEFPIPGEEVRNTCSLREELIRTVHRDGHPGVGKTIQLMSRYYYWPGMTTSVKDFVRGCMSCQRNKPRNHRAYGRLHPMEMPTRRWSDISMDFITRLPMSSKGHDSILVIVDKYSKRAHFIPCDTTISSKQTAHLFFEHIYKLHGIPLKIISDRGTQFLSNFWKTLFDLLRTNLARSASYKPQTNGQTERVNRVLGDFLRTYTQNGILDWEEVLPIAEFVYNNTETVSTGYTPFMLDTGQDPIDTNMYNLSNLVGSQSQQVENKFKYEQDAIDYLECWKDHELVAQAMLKDSQERMIKYFDKDKTAITFEIGEKVLLDTKHLSFYDNKGHKTKRKKLDERSLGPYEILEIFGPLNNPTAVRLKLPSHQTFHDVVPVSRIDKIRLSTQFPEAHNEISPLPVVTDAGDDEFEVQAILKTRMLGNVREYWVRWKGFDTSHNSWEPLSSLTNCDELLQNFLAKQPKLRRSPRLQI